MHVLNIVIVVVVVCSQISLVSSNADPEDFLRVNPKTYRDVDPTSFVATRLCKSDGCKYGAVDYKVQYVRYSPVFRFL
jgi:hypothetical protein